MAGPHSMTESAGNYITRLDLSDTLSFTFGLGYLF
jgi:hypothetical protein